MAIKPRIGNIIFEDMRGNMIPDFAEGSETFMRKGLDGLGYRSDAKRAMAIEKSTTEWVGSDNEAISTSRAYSRLKNTKVRVIERTGREIFDVLVLEVQVQEPQQLKSSYPAGYKWQIRARWFLQPTRVEG